MQYRKQLQKGQLLYVHINLSVSLLLALSLFVVGIELPKTIPVSELSSFTLILANIISGYVQW